MPNPFPGVDPYIESQHYWQDFHVRFINSCSEAISAVLPDAYDVRIEEQVHLIQLDFDDASLPRQVREVMATAEVASGRGAAFQPVTIPFPSVQEVRERWIEIVHRSDRTLATTLKVLSPTDKTDTGHAIYVAKRYRWFLEEINVVEVDLLLSGQRLRMRQPLPSGDYFAFVAPSELRPKAKVYSWTVSDPLPAIPLPLRHERHIVLKLAAAFAEAYEHGRYDRSLNYATPLEVPLSLDIRNWAQNLAARRIHPK